VAKVVPGKMSMEIFEDGTTLVDIKVSYPSPQQAGVSVSRLVTTLAKAFCEANPGQSYDYCVECVMEGVRYGLKHYKDDVLREN